MIGWQWVTEALKHTENWSESPLLYGNPSFRVMNRSLVFKVRVLSNNFVGVN